MLEFISHIAALFMSYTNELARDIIGAAGIFLLFLLLRKIFTRYIFKFVLNLCSRSKFKLNDKLLLAFEKPLRSFFLIFGGYLAMKFLPLGPAADLFINKLFRSFFILLIAWGIYNLAGNNSFLSDEIKEKLKLDSILIPWFTKLGRFIIIALAIVLFAHEWGYDVNGFIAGLGLGGLALALAAKDVLANIFGGIVIIMEKPFSIGDTVSTASVEGTVEDISFRSTLFRNTAQALVTVPNSKLVTEAISNLSRMGKRRVSFTLGLNKASSAAQMGTAIQRIRETLSKREDIYQDSITVVFDSFKDSSLELLITYFTKTTDWSEHLQVKEDINLQIMQIVQDEELALVLTSPISAAASSTKANV